MIDSKQTRLYMIKLDCRCFCWCDWVIKNSL
ncbi:hypothetical protein [Acinetobacter phage Ab69]|nr:hypothetical protein [Acinetobacter phage Ab69]